MEWIQKPNNSNLDKKGCSVLCPTFCPRLCFIYHCNKYQGQLRK